MYLSEAARYNSGCNGRVMVNEKWDCRLGEPQCTHPIITHLLTDVTQRIAQYTEKRLHLLQIMPFSDNQGVWCVISITYVVAARYAEYPVSDTAKYLSLNKTCILHRYAG